MIILDKVRRQNLPNVGDLSGNRSALPLPEGNGLLEPTYFAFLEHNAVAVLLSGNGPRPKRLTSYLKAKMGVSIGLVPILREDFETVLREMRITRVDVAVPADRISRDLVGGDWVTALDGARQLAQEGTITIGMSVGRKSIEEKVRLGERFRGLVNELLQGGGLGSFKRARVEGRMPDGSQEVVDLIEDRLVQKVEVDPQPLLDPEQGSKEAKQILVEQARIYADVIRRSSTLEADAPELTVGPFRQDSEDEQRRNAAAV